MSKHVIKVQNSLGIPCLDRIRDGTKSVEGRANKPSYQKLQVGDTIEFVAEGEEPVLCTVVYIHKYASLNEYLTMEGVERALPWLTSDQITEATAIYETFYPKGVITELAQKNDGIGFLGIGVQVVSEQV